MLAISENSSQILVNTQTSKAVEIDEFKRLNDPDQPKRVILLISKGVESWNCPSLFACALIKEQTSSNNYVLQAATRYLRQVDGNARSAKIFLDVGNAQFLDRELQDNFGTNLSLLSANIGESKTVTVRILKTKLPELTITRTIRRAVRKSQTHQSITLNKPKLKKIPPILRSLLTPDFDSPREMLMPTGDTIELPTEKRTTDCHAAAYKIAAIYHVSAMLVLKKLQALYPQGNMPSEHLYGLFQQVEQQQADYEEIEECITEAMALIRMQDKNGDEIFEKDQDGVPVHHLRMLKRTYDRMKQYSLFAENTEYTDNKRVSFHYNPYNFDSAPEGDLFQKVLSILNTNPSEVQAFLFTGGLTDPAKTDFHFEYLGEDKRYHRYFPDFVLVKNSGEFYIIEVKADKEKEDKIVQAKAKAVKRLQKMQPEQFKYQVIYTPASTVGVEDLQPLTDWVKGDNNATA